VASCPHCFNTIANEYPQLGGTYEVIHHTQLLARLVEQGKLTPTQRVEEKLTYHDPCFLGRHNRVFTPPREILEAVPGVRAEEMHRCKERGFCCGAGGARMWMEERIGKRINTERIEEALALSPDTISTACPYCLVTPCPPRRPPAKPRKPSRSSTSPSSWPAPSPPPSLPPRAGQAPRRADRP
jgi:Fe-S oxidoreductase